MARLTCVVACRDEPRQRLRLACSCTLLCSASRSGARRWERTRLFFEVLHYAEHCCHPISDYTHMHAKGPYSRPLAQLAKRHWPDLYERIG
jgi:hypothetical protein